jgi:GNAT superfamily N-acetyltransferase
MFCGDVAAAVKVSRDADAGLRRVAGLPDATRSDEAVARAESCVAHFLQTDPDGSWIAEDGGQVIAFAQAHCRDDLWVLPYLFVAPHAQGAGVGRALLESALAYGSAGAPGIIVCSRDPRAIRRYALAGFTLHPTVVAWGPVSRSTLPPTPAARFGGSADLGLTATIDRRQRGAARVRDIEACLAEGDQLLVVPERAYALVRGPRIGPLAALDEDAAAQLLSMALAEVCAGYAEVSRITARQQWAVRVAIAARLEIHPHGPVFIRGDPGPLCPYLPDGVLG